MFTVLTPYPSNSLNGFRRVFLWRFCLSRRTEVTIDIMTWHVDLSFDEHLVISRTQHG